MKESSSKPTDASILIVEDEYSLRRLLDLQLSKRYSMVETAADSEVALRKLSKHRFDLIISDIMMPKMSGVDLQAELQKHKKTRAIPFIFLTSKPYEQSFMPTGVDAYITKPFDTEQLFARIDRLLERTKIFQEQLATRIGQDFVRKLMPKKLPQVDGYRAFFHNSPLEQGGGDLFDWTEPEPGIFFFTIGKVRGKGFQAKFYAFSFLAYVRTTLHAMLQDLLLPAELMRRVNRVLMQDEFMEETFASLLIMQWDPATHQITYANAGHCRPVIVSPEGAKIVTYSDMELGLDMNAEFQDTNLTIPPHSALIIYTDGLIEQHLESGQMIGEEGILDMVPTAMDQPDPIDSLLGQVLQQSQDDEFTDTVLVFWLERKK